MMTRKETEDEEIRSDGEEHVSEKRYIDCYGNISNTQDEFGDTEREDETSGEEESYDEELGKGEEKEADVRDINHLTESSQAQSVISTKQHPQGRDDTGKPAKSVIPTTRRVARSMTALEGGITD